MVFCIGTVGKWNMKDAQHRLPLHDAVFNGHVKCSKALIESSGDEVESQILQKGEFIMKKETNIFILITFQTEKMDQLR